MKLLWWIVLALVAVVLILFAISNRQTVSLSLWLLPGTAIELPLYLLVLGTLLVGFVAGELAAWVGGWRWRREARRSRDRIAMLERELEAERARPVVAAASTDLVRS
jgi:lipopolysaccharide assembly protein A